MDRSTISIILAILCINVVVSNAILKIPIKSTRMVETESYHRLTRRSAISVPLSTDSDVVEYYGDIEIGTPGQLIHCPI